MLHHRKSRRFPAEDYIGLHTRFGYVTGTNANGNRERLRLEQLMQPRASVEYAVEQASLYCEENEKGGSGASLPS